MNTILLFAALISAPTLSPKASDQSADIKAIKATHTKLLAEFKARNADAIKALLAKGFIQTANGRSK